MIKRTSRLPHLVRAPGSQAARRIGSSAFMSMKASTSPSPLTLRGPRAARDQHRQGLGGGPRRARHPVRDAARRPRLPSKMSRGIDASSNAFFRVLQQRRSGRPAAAIWSSSPVRRLDSARFASQVGLHHFCAEAVHVAAVGGHAGATAARSMRKRGGEFRARRAPTHGARPAILIS